LISIPGQNGIATNDVVIAYQTIASNGDRYAVFVNADSKERSFVLSDIYKDLLQGQVLVDGERAGVEALSDLAGVELTDSAVVLSPLTAAVIHLPYIITKVPDTAPKERTEESVLPIVEEVRYDATLAKGQSYVLQEGKAGKRVLVYKDVLVDGKVVATKLLSETVVDGEARIVVKGSMEANDVVEKPSLSTPTAQASEQTTSTSNNENLPATGDRQSDLALLGLGLAGLGLTIAAQGRNKKSEE
jgi:LPXTG-motif cell wall-anchored protein